MTKEKELQDKIKCIKDEMRAIKAELKDAIEYYSSSSRDYKEGKHTDYLAECLDRKGMVVEGKEDVLNAIRSARQVFRRWGSSSRKDEPLPSKEHNIFLGIEDE